ncbi:MAG: acetyl-CoA carboxylase biotin carboxyl carrier protein [Pseudomonadota bacterium]
MSNPTHDADVAFIKSLAALLREHDLSEVEVKRDYAEDDSLTVRVSRTKAPTAPVQVTTPAAAPAPAQAAAVEPAAPSAPEDPAAHPGAVTSPMVGTAYLSPEPGAPAFVKVGDTISEGQTLLIVEAMKTMNHIHAKTSGIVRRVLVEDGAPVEFGAPLMIIE